jgi:4-hydroxy-tetrahydrodipicolinate synthase
MYNSDVAGIIPPLITPLTSELEFDHEAYGRLIEHVIQGGVNGIFILGTNGEFPNLTIEIRISIIRRAVETIANRVPVFVNISSSSYLETLQLAECTSESGADYVVLSPPYYFCMNQREVVRYYQLVADHSKLPLFLYNAPQYTTTELEPETVSELALHEKIIGIKDSSGNIDYIHRLLDQRRDDHFSILTGLEKILGECILIGCNGGVNGGGNLFPRLYVRMYEAAKRKNLDEMHKLQSIINRIYKYIYEIHDSPNNIILGLKYALSLKGICPQQMAMPYYERISDQQKASIAGFIKETEQYDI